MSPYSSDSYNAGRKLILAARIIRGGGVIGCVALAIFLLTQADSGEEIFTALLTSALCYPCIWLTALLIHGFGVIVGHYEQPAAADTAGVTPSLTATGITPSQAATGITPAQAATGRTPSQAATSRTPAPTATGTTPSQAATGRTPAPTATGRTPAQAATGRTPAPATASHFWWQCTCGHFNTDAFASCTRCGKELRTSDPQGWQCSCGARNVAKRKVCGKCSNPRPDAAS